MPIAFLSLGSNLGDREENLRVAMARLDSEDCRIVAVSGVVETEPVGETEQPVPNYLNCAVKVETALLPLELLERTQAVEREGGRTPTFRWGPRTIDIDILLYDRLSIATDRLTIPHPRLRERAFVLAGLAELAPDLTLPDGTRIADARVDPCIGSQVVRPWRKPC
jgi:2-amino-4-hydroxy-6-hydroxymethyldihydropteridine diphosphokinase